MRTRSTETRSDPNRVPHYLSEWAQVPAEPNWKQNPNREKEFIIRVKCVRLSSGERLHYYFTVPKPLTKTEQNDMLRRLKAVRAEIRAVQRDNDKDDDSAVVSRERRLLRQTTPLKPRRKK